MANNFEIALKYVLRDEGGNDDDPRDHGGRTSRGITQREYDSWCNIHGRQPGDVWDATDADVRAIYHDQYWLPYCDKLPSGIDYCFFDISVNAGRQRAVKTFQKVLGVNIDGMMGQVTLAAILNYPNKAELIKRVSEERRRWYRALKQFPIFGKGWLNRTNHCEQGALALASKEEYISPASIPKVPKTKNAELNRPTASPETSGTVTGGLGGLTALINSLKESLEPYQYILKPAMYAVLALTVAGAIYTGWSWYKERKMKQVLL